MMDAYNISVKLKNGRKKLFVVPFEMPGHPSSIAYLLVWRQKSIGSITFENYRWKANDKVPLDDDDLQIIGKEIEARFFLSV